VIVIGEMRDPDSIAGALTAAETGHLVLASLHTSDAGKTVDRIVDAFASGGRDQIRTQLARVLVGVVCQQLVRRIGGGRLAVFEVLVATDAVRALIRDNKVHQLKNAIATGRQFGMQTLESHVAALVDAGEIEPPFTDPETP
jgi:twitching motility protein PilT